MMNMRKRKERNKDEAEGSLSSTSSSIRNSSTISYKNDKISRKDITFYSVEPKNTSTPMNFKIYPLHKNRKKSSESFLQQDFNIYEELKECEYENLSDCNSGFDSFESNSGDLSGIKIYEDFDDFSEDLEREELNIFENVVFLNSLEIDEKDLNDNYEIVTVKNSKDVTKARKFRPRTLKTGSKNCRF